MSCSERLGVFSITTFLPVNCDCIALEKASLSCSFASAWKRRMQCRCFAVAVPMGMVGLVHPRSGLAARVGLSIVNSPGTIDAGYRGEIKISLINLDPAEPIVIKRGDRIAQLLVQRVELPELVEVSSFDEAGLGETIRGEGGHGSSGGHASL